MTPRGRFGCDVAQAAMHKLTIKVVAMPIRRIKDLSSVAAAKIMAPST